MKKNFRHLTAQIDKKYILLLQKHPPEKNHFPGAQKTSRPFQENLSPLPTYTVIPLPNFSARATVHDTLFPIRML